MEKEDEQETIIKECECEELKYTNVYTDSYQCKKCRKIFVIRHDMMSLQKGFKIENKEEIYNINNVSDSNMIKEDLSKKIDMAIGLTIGFQIVTIFVTAFTLGVLLFW